MDSFKKAIFVAASVIGTIILFVIFVLAISPHGKKNETSKGTYNIIFHKSA